MQILGVAATAAVKGAVHGVVGGAISAARGGSFAEGFAANAIGAVVGVYSDIISMGDMALDTAISAAAGCAGALVSGGKCANGALTAAFANMYNKWGQFSAQLARRFPKTFRPVDRFVRQRFVNSGPKHITRVVKDGVGGFVSRGGYRSFTAFKRDFGAAGPDRQWHHIVEQGQSGRFWFGSFRINHPSNLISLGSTVHTRISGFYSSKQLFTGGQTVRKWLGSQSFAKQRQFGLDTLRRFND